MPKEQYDSGPSWPTLLGIAGARFTSADQSGSAAAVHTAPGRDSRPSSPTSSSR